MRLTVELEFEGFPVRGNAEAELDEFLRKLARVWGEGATLTTRSIEMCGFAGVELVGARRARKA